MALGFYLFDRTKGATSISHSLTQEVHKRVLKSVPKILPGWGWGV